MIELFSKQGVSVPITTKMVWEAYQHVKQGGEAAGTDGMTWEYLHTHRSKLLYQLWIRLASGSYFPKAIKAVSIEKKDGSKRVLGLPTLLDRIAQQVVRVHLEKCLEPRFHQNSYGYRPGKSMHDAINKAKFNCQQYPYVMTLDIKSYFDTIPHDKLLKALQFYCKEKWVSLYVSRWLKASIVNEDGSKTQPQSGTPQGGVISPLLANLYLHVVFDGWMLHHYPGIRFERYADDIIIHTRREQIAQSILNKLQKRFTECGLTIHPAKTQIICVKRDPTKRSVNDVHTFEMGGFAFTPQWVKVQGERQLLILPSPSKASKKRIMDKIRSLRLHTRTGSIYVVANLLNPLVRGWQNYYCYFIKRDLNDLWRFVNRRLEKWCKWNKRMHLRKSRRWLNTLYKLQPGLFAHWSVCPAY
ncbi:MAG: group II intron reverse transcriptase/maturase [Chitinophagaceae bacterium]